MSLIFLFDIFSVAVPDPSILLWMSVSTGAAAAVNPNGTNTHSWPTGSVHSSLMVDKI